MARSMLKRLAANLLYRLPFLWKNGAFQRGPRRSRCSLSHLSLFKVSLAVAPPGYGEISKHYLNLGTGTKSPKPRRTIFVSVGPVSSLHDRACELYYALRGGTVDYGTEHSEIHNHSRYGRGIPQGQYPHWSPDKPLHFLGHSIGGPTIIKLQSLIKQGHFGPGAQTRMIFSINAVSSPFRGTPAVYLLGERADAAPAVRPLSFGSMVGKGVHILSFISPLLPRALDLHGDCRSLTYRDVSFLSLLKQLWKSDWAESRDATPFDVTFQAADERETNGEGNLDPNTFYQSHVARMTRARSEGLKTHIPSMYNIASLLMYLSARRLGRFDYSILSPPPSFLHPDLGEEYWANDGVVPIFSQWHPLPCRHTRCNHLKFSSQLDDDSNKLTLEPGVWYVNEEENATHLSLIPLWTGTERQQRFWRKLGEWLTTVEGKRKDC
ncbi:alpha/beta-hydrolase [Mycena alexandri]|uniref:Alpha/beta-hydrolase n=1 Tax=Mycena alexandri TaxID=1745969 RepID=A0AAD6TAP2_9AGAR|nr:alpha/beta-hydrolase [Mycena alexandri]